MLNAPVAKTIAPTAIALTSIAITLVFIFHASLAHELDVFNRLVTGHSHAVHQARSKAPVTQRPFVQNLLMDEHIKSQFIAKGMLSSMRADPSQFLEFVPLRIIFLAQPKRREGRFLTLNDSSAWLSTPNTIPLAYHRPSNLILEIGDKGSLSPSTRTPLSRIDGDEIFL